MTCTVVLWSFDKVENDEKGSLRKKLSVLRRLSLIHICFQTHSVKWLSGGSGSLAPCFHVSSRIGGQRPKLGQLLSIFCSATCPLEPTAPTANLNLSLLGLTAWLFVVWACGSYWECLSCGGFGHNTLSTERQQIFWPKAKWLSTFGQMPIVSYCQPWVLFHCPNANVQADWSVIHHLLVDCFSVNVNII